MEPDRETLNAFVDGELPPKEMEEIAALLAVRPDLDRYVREQERLRETLRETYPLEADVPEKLIEAVRSAPVSWRWRLRGLQERFLSIRILVPAGAALALGVMIGFALRPASDFGTDGAGRLVAQGNLGKALTTQLAAAGRHDGGAQIGISFRSKAGYDCRTFTLRSEAGLACRQEGHWIVETLVKQAPEYPEADYRMAGAMPEAVRRAVAASIDGAPFDAAAERQARDRGWSGRKK